MRREPRLDGLVVLDATALRINAQHLAGPQLSASNPAVTADVHHARLRGAANQTVLADHVAQRSQAVAIQRGADPDAVREHQTGRSIPGFHQARVVAIEIADRGIDVKALPGLGDQHRQGVADVAPAPDQQLERVIEHRRIRPLLIDDRPEEVFVDRPIRPQPPFPRSHPIDIALDGVDLAVVSEQTERLGSLPGRGGVGAVALMEDRERSGESRIAQVRVEAGQLIGGAHRLVGHGLKRHRGKIPAEPGGRDRTLGAFAGTVTSRLGLRISGGRFRPEDGLFDLRSGGSGFIPERIRLDRDVAPAGDLELLGVTRVFECMPNTAPRRIPLVAGEVREKNRGDPNPRR